MIPDKIFSLCWLTLQKWRGCCKAIIKSVKIRSAILLNVGKSDICNDYFFAFHIHQRTIIKHDYIILILVTMFIINYNVVVHPDPIDRIKYDIWAQNLDENITFQIDSSAFQKCYLVCLEIF